MPIITIKYKPEEANAGGEAHLPLSKSIALRAMTLNAVATALGKQPANIPILPDSEDVEGMTRAVECYLSQLPQAARTSDDKSDSDNKSRSNEKVDSTEKADATDKATVIPAKRVNIGEGGAPFRFFTALAAATPGIELYLDAEPALKRRPMAILFDALRRLGASLSCTGMENYPPIEIHGESLPGGEISLNPGVSSQFISALMMAAPLMSNPLTITFAEGRHVSTPYIEMTAALMRQFGIPLTLSDERITIQNGIITPPENYPIEPDWSAASYFYELAILLPGKDIPLAALTPAAASLQGDSRCAEIFSLIGVETRIRPDGSAILHCDPEKLKVFSENSTPLTLDMNDTPDLVPALAVGFCLAGIRFRFTNVGHLRHKETDRLMALSIELEKLGYMLTADENTLSWEGRRYPASDNEAIATYSDHRMAMAFAPAAARLPWIAIENPEVVGKSFPGYWEALAALGFSMESPAAGISKFSSKY